MYSLTTAEVRKIKAAQPSPEVLAASTNPSDN
jgi:hypothetical protein